MKVTRRVYGTAALITGFALATTAVLLWPSDKQSIVLVADNASVVARGKDIYAAQCASCHGPNLEGQENWRQRQPDGLLPAPPHDETGHTWHHPDAVLFDLTKRGPAALAGGGYRSAMPSYEDALSDDEIIAVLSYIKSRWPEPVRDRHDTINDRAR